MATRLRLYLDTSVVSAYFDARVPVRQEQTKAFWEKLAVYDPAISPIVREEIQETPDPVRRAEMLQLIQPLSMLAWTEEMEFLSQAYVTSGAFATVFVRDSRHVAAAVVSGIPVLLSWNFRHLVNRVRRAGVNLVNLQQGYGQVEIISPPELG